MKPYFLFFIFCFLFAFKSIGQSVVISTYFNAADPRDEWIELLVIADNTDMRNWSLRDNNSSQNSWQTAVTFNNVAFWSNMRAGTCIMIWNRPLASDGVTIRPSVLDVNKADGYIELDASNATYFSGGSLGSSPSWAGGSLNFAGGGDVLQLRDGTSTHVHALGHISSPGTDWTALPSPKLNHANNANSGDAIYVCPGAAIADYGTSAPQSGTTWTSKNNGTITFGLPNVSGGSPTQNTLYWNSIREPIIASQIVNPTSQINGSPGSITFTWAAATDPNPSDVTTGYIILRNTTNSFSSPSDGTTYANGATIGTATVLTHINSSTITTYTDNNVYNGTSYFYQVYAFRYSTDNLNGNSYHQSRGRAYNQTNFVTVNSLGPLAVELTQFSASKKYNGTDISGKRLQNSITGFLSFNGVMMV